MGLRERSSLLNAVENFEDAMRILIICVHPITTKQAGEGKASKLYCRRGMKASNL